MLNKLSIKDIELGGRRVFIRVDFNVPLDSKQNITDDTRIRESLETIRYAGDAGARILLASHLGRPKGRAAPEMSLAPVASRLAELLGRDVLFAPDCIGPEVERLAAGLGDGDILLLENLRFHAGESENNPEFAKALSAPAEVYINDAFGTAHRAHASTVGVTSYLHPCAAGFLMEKEILYFDKALAKPARPFCALLGGAKVSTKIPIIANLLDKVDLLLVGGGMAFTFLKAEGLEIGNSLLEAEMVEQAALFMRRAGECGKELLLPVDVVMAKEFRDDSAAKTVPVDGIESGWMGLDIGPETISSWSAKIRAAKTIVWNGPMGAFEMPSFSRGTVALAKAVAESGAVSIVGGGDSVAALDVAGVRDRISHVSTGGGASLDFLAGKELPAIAALTDKE